MKEWKLWGWIFGVSILGWSACESDRKHALPIDILPPDVSWVLTFEKSPGQKDSTLRVALDYLGVPTEAWIPMVEQLSMYGERGLLAAIDTAAHRYLLIWKTIKQPPGAMSLLQKYGISKPQVFDFRGHEVVQGAHSGQRWVMALYQGYYLVGHRAVDVEGALDMLFNPIDSEEGEQLLSLYTDRPSVSFPSLFTAQGAQLFPQTGKSDRWARVEMVPEEGSVFLEGQLIPHNNTKSQGQESLLNLLLSLPDHAAFVHSRTYDGTLISKQKGEALVQNTAWAMGYLKETDATAFGLFPAEETVVADLPIIETETYQTFEIVQLLDSWEVPGYTKWTNPVLCETGSHLLIAPNVAAMKLWIDYLIVGKTPGQNTAFLEQAAPYLTEWVDFYFAKNQSAPIGESKKAFWRIAATQGSDNLRLDYRSRWVKPGIAATRLPQLAWRLSLAGPVIAGPWWLPNADRWVVQDSTFQLTIADWDGTLMAQKRLDGPVVGDVAALAKTGHIACNTMNKLYVFDGNGSNQPAFPMDIQTGATAGLLATELDENGQYQFFVPTSNGIYGFSDAGLPLPGWQPKRDSVTPHFPLVHIVEPDRDLMIAMDSSGRVKASDRFGQDLWYRDLAGTFRQGPMPQLVPGYERLVVVDEEGFANIIPMGQEAAPFRTHLAMERGGNQRYLFAPFFGDERLDYIVQRGDQIRGFGYSGTKLQQAFSVAHPAVLHTLFEMRMGEQVGFGAVSLESKVYAYYANGQLLPGFPLVGDTPMVWNRSGDLFIVGLQDEMLGFQLILE
jgi:hypothetical protein